MPKDRSLSPDDSAGGELQGPVQDSRPTPPEPRVKARRLSATNGDARGVWLDVIADLIVKEALDDQKSETPS
jgi:hypothetical protein